MVTVKERKKFVEPEVVMCEEPLDKVTLTFNGSPGDTCGDGGSNYNWWDWWKKWW
jgi:hypothetical protein